MFKVIKTAALLPAEIPPTPFVGTRIGLRLDDPASLTFGFKDGTLAEGRESVTVDWGDGAVGTFTTLAGQTHAYAGPGEYEVKVSDDIGLIAISSKIASSDYYLKYAPMVVTFQSNATRLTKLKDHCFNSCVNFSSFDATDAAIGEIALRAFVGCAALAGTVRFPHVTAISGTGPFQGCSSIGRLVFAEANRAAIEATTAYQADRTLGSGVEVEFEELSCP